MACNQSNRFQQLVSIDENQQQEQQEEQQPYPGGPRVRGGCTGVFHLFSTMVLLVVTIGFCVYLMYNTQKELRDLRKMSQEFKLAQELSRAKMQICSNEAGGNKEDKKESQERAAAHVIGRIEKGVFSKTLHWEANVGAAFTGGGVAYQAEDGALRVNQSGLYHIYSRVEFIFKQCSPTSFFHTVFLRRSSGYPDVALMEAPKAGFCPQQNEPNEQHAWTADSYLASALWLCQDDRVLVNVSHPQYLSHSSHGNFFGLYKI
ncbi:tumor necrosis factor ligand superfamily member 6-like [Syngnathoides biaculeatus]|uniref:tumor necrosis factor ligand superfamily member 6-like n=1 Tax=Syngnathoides biaculeatus TaxID=300417 RepID=UPI002ADE5569|nr:tumor necrosis factor ligand superfamily member 6-like [Syngnathoides biaculeatus]